MRNITTCYSEHAVKVSSSYCSGPAANQAYLSPNLVPSVQNAATCIYKVKLCTNQRLFFIRITWSNLAAAGQGFSIGISDDSCSISKFSKNSRQLKKVKGTKSFDCCNNSRIEVLWDLSEATYDSGRPEPINGYYVVVLVNSELSLLLGEIEEESELKKRISDVKYFSKYSLLSRSEQFYGGNALFSTKAQFLEGGNCHDIVIKCGEENGSKNSSVLSVTIDKKNMIHVRRLQWNFRGNQTIFVDGLIVDMMWDVHGWFFNPTTTSDGYAFFMFRTRSGLDSRLWLEEKFLEQKEQEKVGFSLLICACKSPD
ncbi:hypothetical protein M9H77_24151 [Catharanthus roseus]|uniref:Uncharacterized protein n=1 Tax=Catharanthus roseus TaxID=4058 RepID=A0ACC0AV16_CATRO|nr:hypothetical protein M9H77_24151 [Catharanthus roseus]